MTSDIYLAMCLGDMGQGGARVDAEMHVYEQSCEVEGQQVAMVMVSDGWCPYSHDGLHQSYVHLGVVLSLMFVMLYRIENMPSLPKS